MDTAFSALIQMQENQIIIDWRDVYAKPHRWAERWDYTLALYGILHPWRDEVLYLGKADGTRVRIRWNADDKHERVWRRIEDERRIFKHSFIIGEFRLSEGRRLTRQLVSDIESLLIYEINPWANTSNTGSRSYGRYDMTVFCQGDWPLKRKRFRDG